VAAAGGGALAERRQRQVVFGSARARRAGPSIVTIGNFDGVHLGHQALLSAARRLATPRGAQVVAYTFDPLPRDVMAPGHGVPRIQTLQDRAAALLAAGADRVVIERFSRVLSRRTPMWFVHTALRDRLGAVGAVVGWDFRFGRDRGGDAELLAAELEVAEVVGAVELDGLPVSSTRARRAVLDGDLTLAGRLLGRPHTLAGPVVHGDARGRTIGFPTANVAVETELLPPTGVYAVRALVDGAAVPGVANLGVRPTFGGGRLGLEVHLLGWSGDLYGRRLIVEVVGRVRGEQRFAGVEALRAQIALDVAAAKALLGEAP
jgi:riboflavin kinase/FMN adenylyltransferase